MLWLFSQWQLLPTTPCPSSTSQAGRCEDWPWPRCGIGCPWASTNEVKSSNSCRMTITLTPSSLHGEGTANNITDLPTWFWIIIQFSMMPPVLQNTGYLNPGTPFHWVKSSIDFLKNLNPLSSVRLKRVSESLIHQNQLAWPSTCKGWYGIRSWLRNTINIHSQNPLLLHKLESNTFWQPIHSCYWFIHAPVQGKILEVVDALNKTKFLVLGCSILIIAVDHKPLQKVFDDDEISNACLPNHKEKTVCYQFHKAHFPVALHEAASAFSCHPTGLRWCFYQMTWQPQVLWLLCSPWPLCPLIYGLHELSLIPSSLNP